MSVLPQLLSILLGLAATQSQAAPRSPAQVKSLEGPDAQTSAQGNRNPPSEAEGNTHLLFEVPINTDAQVEALSNQEPSMEDPDNENPPTEAPGNQTPTFETSGKENQPVKDPNPKDHTPQKGDKYMQELLHTFGDLYVAPNVRLSDLKVEHRMHDADADPFALYSDEMREIEDEFGNGIEEGKTEDNKAEEEDEEEGGGSNAEVEEAGNAGDGVGRNDRVDTEEDDVEDGNVEDGNVYGYAVEDTDDNFFNYDFADDASKDSDVVYSTSADTHSETHGRPAQANQQQGIQKRSGSRRRWGRNGRPRRRKWGGVFRWG